MIKIEDTEVMGWEHAIRGMRNPLESWEKLDSYRCEDYPDCVDCPQYDYDKCGEVDYNIGIADLDLMKRLSNAGTDHSKYLRMVTVYADITAPMYWWKEFDTYKVGTVRNSCSTMHKIHAKEFTLDDFSTEHLLDFSWNRLDDLIGHLNICRENFIATKNKEYWWQMIQLLPSSYNQKSTVMLNYQVLKNMYHSRKNHKLDEWHTFCEWVESLPYAKELIVGEEVL